MLFWLPPPLKQFPSIYVCFTQRSNQVRAGISLISDECTSILTDLSNIYDILSRTARRIITITDKSVILIRRFAADISVHPVVFSMNTYTVIALLCATFISTVILLASSFTAMYIFLILCANVLHFLVCILVLVAVLACAFWSMTTCLYIAYNGQLKQAFSKPLL